MRNLLSGESVRVRIISGQANEMDAVVSGECCVVCDGVSGR